MRGEQTFTCPKCFQTFDIDLGPEGAGGDALFCPHCRNLMRVPRRVCLNCVHCSGQGGHISVRNDKLNPHIPLAKCHSLTASGLKQAITMQSGISFLPWTAAEECDEFKLKTLVRKS